MPLNDHTTGRQLRSRLESATQAGFVTDARHDPNPTVQIGRLDHHGPALRASAVQRFVHAAHTSALRHRYRRLGQQQLGPVLVTREATGHVAGAPREGAFQPLGRRTPTDLYESRARHHRHASGQRSQGRTQCVGRQPVVPNGF